MAGEGYQRQVNPSTVTLRAPRAPVSAASVLAQGFGALAGAAGDAAKVNYQVKEAQSEDDFKLAQLEKQRRQSATRAAKAGQLAEASTRLDASSEKIPEYSAPGATGYAAARAKQIDAEYDGLLADVTDPEDRQWLEPIIAERKAQAKQAAQGYEDTTARGYSADQLKVYGDSATNDLMANPSGENLATKLKEFNTISGGLHLDGRTGPALQHVVPRQMVGGLLDGLLQKRDNAGVIAVLDSGQLNALLTPEESKSYRGLANNGIEAEARQADMAQAEERKAAKEGLNAIKARIDHGDTVPQSEIKAALDRAGQAGVPQSELLDFAYIGEDALETKGLQQSSTSVLEGQRDQLRAKVQAGTASDGERRQLERMDKELNVRGGSQAQQLAPLFKGTPEQRMQGMTQLSGMGIEERWRVAGDGNGKFALLAGAPGITQATAAQGQLVRQQQPDAALPPIGTMGHDARGVPKQIKTKQDQEAEVDSTLEEILGPDLARTHAPHMRDLREATLDIVAGRQTNWNPKSADKAVRTLFGGTARSDGSWQGGIGTVYDRKMELPPKWNESEFSNVYGRYSFPGAVYSDGKTSARPEDVRKNFHLEYQGTNADGALIYYLVNDQQKPLLQKDSSGKTHIFRLPVDPMPPTQRGK